MNLQQLYDKVNRGSYYSRAPVEIWDALSDASLELYRRILKECRGYFIKWDTTTVAIVPGQDEYSLPADCAQLIRVSEQAAGEIGWRTILPSDLNSAATLARQWDDFISYDSSPMSQFLYYGPYLPATTAEEQGGAPTDTYNIRFTPIPQITRTVQLIYTASFVEITGANSYLTIPLEGHDALAHAAIGHLLQLNNDSLSQQFQQDSMMKTESFLTFVRARQIQEGPVQEPYLGDLD